MTVERPERTAFVDEGQWAYAAFSILFIAAFLDPILRISAESDITLFRVGIFAFLAVFSFKLLRLPGAKTAIAIGTVWAIYMACQILIFGHWNNFSVLSYAALVLCLIVYLFINYSCCIIYNTISLFKLLYFWYIFIVLLSIIQLLTDLKIPNAPFRESVARIYFGQENDTSTALAAFFPFLLYRLRKDAFAAPLLIAGIATVYLNGTRMVLLAIGFYLCLLGGVWIVNQIRLHTAVKAIWVWCGFALVAAFAAYLARDIPIEFPDHSATLTEMVFLPIDDIMEGRLQVEQITSINIRITAAIAGVHAYLQTLGFGIGPGASRFIIAQYYPASLVTSMHSFPLQVLVEFGWLAVVTVVFLAVRLRNSMNWEHFVPYLTYMIAVVSSATSGTVTNYFLFSCLVLGFFVFRNNVLNKFPTWNAVSWPDRKAAE